MAKDIGIEIMASARSYFSRPDRLVAEINRLLDAGELDGARIDASDPLGFLADAKGVESLTDGSYRFVAHEPGVHVVLVGTGNVAHLEENVRALSAGPLPAQAHASSSRSSATSIAVDAPWRPLSPPC